MKITDLLFWLNLLVVLTIVVDTINSQSSHNIEQINTVSGFVYDNPKCDGVVNGVNRFRIAVYRDGVFWKFVTTVLGGLYAINNLEDNINYRFQFARHNGEVNATFRFPSGDNNVRFDVNRADCSLYIPLIEKGRPSQ